MDYPGNLFVVAAPSGAGKSSLVKALLELDSHVQPSVSHTTRAPRGQEKHGREYFFASDAEFDQMVLADGSVFTSIESYNAISFNLGAYSGNQGQVAQWLANGGTAGVGYVQEPTGSWVTVTNEDILFRSLLSGMTFGEAAWAATYQLSFVNTVIGDPLMVWHVLSAGDISRDGIVDISTSPIGAA